MTKKDYILIAKVLLKTRPNKTWLNKYQQWIKDTESIAEALKNTNINYNAQKFLKACGTELEY